MTSTNPDGASTATTADLTAAGVTARQVDYWVTKGRLQAEHPAPGTGQPLRFPPAEVRITRVMAALIAAGISAPRAAELARCADGGAGRLRQLAAAVETLESGVAA